MRALLIAADPAFAASVELTLKAADWNLYCTGDAEEGVDLARLYDYDVLLTASSGLSSDETLRGLRAAGVKTPVVVISADAGIDDKVRAFALGADDHLTTPFHTAELVARMTAIVRRTRGHARAAIIIGELSVDLDQKVASLAGERLALTGTEYQLLELLALRRGTVITKEMALDHLYGGMDEPGQKIIDVYLCKLRAKLRAADPDHDYIETVWGRGFMMREIPALRGARAA